MSVVSTIDTVGPCRKRLEIEVPAPAVDAETSRVIDEFRRKVRLPGFRKGKVPASVVQKRFRGEIEREVLDRLVPRYWKQAEAESSLDVLAAPKVEDVELHEGQPLTFVATVEVRPEIELGDLEVFDLPESVDEPTEAEIAEALERLQSQVGDWLPVDRPAARGDLAKISSVELDAAGDPLGEPAEVEVEVGSPNVWEELSLALTGLEAGQETDFRRQEEAGEETRVRHFRVQLIEVREKEMPPLDDELAAKLGNFESFEALHQHVVERLTLEKRAAGKVAREQALLEQLRQRHPLELPTGVVDEESRHLLQEYAESLARQGVDVEHAAIDWESLLQEVRPQAERRVHSRLLLDAIAGKRDLRVEPEELEERLAQLAKAQNRSTASVRQALSGSGQLEVLRRQMTREKVIEELLAGNGTG